MFNRSKNDPERFTDDAVENKINFRVLWEDVEESSGLAKLFPIISLIASVITLILVAVKK